MAASLIALVTSDGTATYMRTDKTVQALRIAANRLELTVLVVYMSSLRVYSCFCAAFKVV